MDASTSLMRFSSSLFYNAVLPVCLTAAVFFSTGARAMNGGANGITEAVFLNTILQIQCQKYRSNRTSNSTPPPSSNRFNSNLPRPIHPPNSGQPSWLQPVKPAPNATAPRSPQLSDQATIRSFTLKTRRQILTETFANQIGVNHTGATFETVKNKIKIAASDASTHDFEEIQKIVGGGDIYTYLNSLPPDEIRQKLAAASIYKSSWTTDNEKRQIVQVTNFNGIEITRTYFRNSSGVYVSVEAMSGLEECAAAMWLSHTGSTGQSKNACGWEPT